MKKSLFAAGLLAASTSFALADGHGPKTAELVAELPQSVGNVTFTPTNRVIFSHHPFFSPDVRVAELNDDR